MVRMVSVSCITAPFQHRRVAVAAGMAAAEEEYAISKADGFQIRGGMARRVRQGWDA